MEEIRRAVVEKLERLERNTDCQIKFWLSHQKYLKPETDTSILLDFLGVQHSEHNGIYFEDDTCEYCRQNTVFYDDRLDEYVCAECGSCQNMIRKVFETHVPESHFYKPSVHLHKLLHEMQCLRHQMPPNIVENVRDYLKKDFTYDRIKKSLRKIGYNQAYAMVYSIQQQLDPNFKPLRLSYEEEENLQGLFWQYLQLDKMGRKNRLNYHFVLEKLSKALGYDHILPYLHPPKGKKSRDESERIWEQVCIKLKWITQKPNQ